MADRSYKRRVSNMLIDRKFQLKYTLIVILLGVAIYAVLGGLYFREKKISTELMDINQSFEKALKKGEPSAEEAELLKSLGSQAAKDDEYVANSMKELDQELNPEVTNRDNHSAYIMLGVVALLVLLLGGAGIWVTHRMVGPLHALTLFMQAVAAGEWHQIRPFRKGDEFTYLADEVNRLAAAIKKCHTDELAVLRQLLAESSALTEEQRTRLTRLIEAKEEYVSD